MESETFDERRERIHLSREHQISELLLRGKNVELNNEKNRTNELNMKLEEIINKNKKIIQDNEKIKKEIEDLMIINKNKKTQNEILNNEAKKLFEELKIGEVIPIKDEEEKDNDERSDDFEEIKDD